jgi:hypothetical protein
VPVLRPVPRIAALLLPAILGIAAVRPAAEDRKPFHVGERFTYDAKINAIHAGSATVSVEGLETVRGVPTYHTIFDVRGRVLFKKFANHYESWFDTTNMVTMRHIQKTDDVDKTYEFYPARKIYIKNDDGIENPSVAMPIDESSFLYFLRSLPLEVGKQYTIPRY